MCILGTFLALATVRLTYLLVLSSSTLARMLVGYRGIKRSPSNSSRITVSSCQFALKSVHRFSVEGGTDRQR